MVGGGERRDGRPLRGERAKFGGLGRAGDGCGDEGMGRARLGHEIGGGWARAAPWIQVDCDGDGCGGCGDGLRRLDREISQGEGRTRAEAW
jgi:hypothetical protein